MNFLKKIPPKNKNVLFPALVAIFAFLGFILPSPASAGVITSVLLALPGILLALWGFFTNLFAQIAIVVFNWVTSPTFIDWSYTQNPVIKVGLGVTKQFVNMGLVVVLIFIALAIALRLKEYASQKTLIRLIAVALLVNFAPVICGLIVDAANIVMNYFLSPIKEGVDSILGGIKGSFAIFSEIMSTRKDPSEQLGLFGRLGVSLIFNAVIGFTFFLLAVIFIVRYLAIWILVILAPLAFVAWILPATKKFWDRWWQQFIQWSIIGIPIAFFLYLAMASLGEIRIQFENKMPMAGLAPEVSMGTNYFSEFFGYMVVLVMIWLGIVIGLQTSAMGATGIMDFAKSKGKTGAKAGAKWTGKTVGRGAVLAARKTREKLLASKYGQRLKEWGQRQSEIKKWGEGETGVGGTVKRTVGTVFPGRYVVRALGRAAGGRIEENKQERIRKIEDSIKDEKRLPPLLTGFHDAITDEKKIAYLNQIIEKNKLGDAMDKKKLGKSAIAVEEVDRLMPLAKKWKTDKTLSKTFPHLAAKYVTDDELSEAQTKDPRINTKEKLILSKIKPSDYKLISEEALKDVNVVDAMLATAMGGHISQLIEQYGREAAQEIEKGIARNVPAGETPAEHLKKINPRLHRYFTAGAGRGLIEIPEQRGSPITETPPKKPIKGPTIGQEIKKRK